MQINLEGKRALVGGSSKGIGNAIARQLAASGATLTLISSNPLRLEAAVKNLPADAGQKHTFLCLDTTDFASYSKAIDRYFQSNTVDILVNNTQGPPGGGSLEKELADYQKAFDLLFKTTVYTTHAALDHMKKQRWGRIINVASVSVKEPLAYLVLSNSIRAAVVSWAKTLSLDTGPFGITVNSLLTGYFDTDRIAELNQKKAEKMGISVEEVREAMEQQVPLKRIGKPEEYGALVTFLASELAGYIHGTAIPIDGGMLHSL